MYKPVTLAFGLSLSLALGAPAPATAAGPSFDCRRASKADEFAICRSETLSALDRTIAAAFNDLKKRFGVKRARQVGGPLLFKRQKCGGNVTCIEAAQRHAIEVYIAAGARIPQAQAPIIVEPE